MIECKYCKNQVSEAEYCSVCKYPLNGTEREQGIFVSKQVRQESDIKDSLKKLKYVRVIPFVIGAFYLLLPFTPLVPTGATFAISISVFIGLAFCCFGALSFKHPKLGFLLPLTFVTLYYLLILIFTPAAFFLGLVWKVIVVAGLSFGLYRVYSSDKILKENSYLSSKLGIDRIGKKKKDVNF